LQPFVPANRCIFDTKGVDMPSYTADLQECQTYAAQVPVGEEVAKGAVRGGAQAEREQRQVVKNCLRGRGYKVLN
jgi:hypothetical protein